MPRRSRFILPGHPQHVIVRGVNREPIFYQEADCHCYLEHLQSAINKHSCALHAYVLMTNHVHMLMTPEKGNGIAKVIQSVGRCYVQYFNHSYRRTGTLWEGRYKSTLVDTDDYLLTCYRYIELNPVRANMIDHPSKYQWSSYRHNAVGQHNELITPHDIYLGLGTDNYHRQQAYRCLYDIEISSLKLDEIRAASNKEWVLGSESFKRAIEKKLQRRTSPLPRGGDRKSEKFKEKATFNRH